MADVPDGKLFTLKMDYADLPAAKLQGVPDMIFIDGDHKYASILRDVRWAQQIMPHGLLCGHDVK